MPKVSFDTATVGLPPFTSDMLLPDLLDALCRQAPQRIAFTCDGVTINRATLMARVHQVATVLAANGVGRGDTVALAAPNSLAAIEVLLGALRAGACIVPLAVASSSDALKGMLQDCDARVLFAGESVLPVLGGMEAMLRERFKAGLVALDFSATGWQNYADWRATASHLSLETKAFPQLHADDPFNIIYSSGTTGLPKGIVHSHDMRVRQALRGGFGLSEDSVALLATPLYSNTTILPMLATLVHGGVCHVMSKFDAGKFLEIAERERVTHTMLVPVQFQRILDHPDFARRDLSSFIVKQCTGAPFAAPLKQRVVERWPGRLIEVYGMTEGGTTCILDATRFPDRLSTVGQPAAGTDLVLLDEDDCPVARGEIGEIVGRSPFMMSGYYKRPDLTQQLQWRDEAGRIHHRSGDVGRLDHEGFLTLLDRKKDLIISGGFNIYPADLEAVLHDHPDVAEATVIGIPSESWGETPLALVVLKPQASLSADSLKQWVNARVGKNERLSVLEFRDELPRSSLGKVMKKELRAQWCAP